jgi:hypothetical protein
MTQNSESRNSEQADAGGAADGQSRSPTPARKGKGMAAGLRIAAVLLVSAYFGIPALYDHTFVVPTGAEGAGAHIGTDGFAVTARPHAVADRGTEIDGEYMEAINFAANDAPNCSILPDGSQGCCPPNLRVAISWDYGYDRYGTNSDAVRWTTICQQ